MDLKDKNICVFCASSPQTKPEYREAAYHLGELMGEEGVSCVCGAGRAGLMQAVTDGVLSKGGKVIGVIPQFMVDNGWNHPHLTETIITPDMHTRKQTMAEKSNAVIALPGGVGTLEEMLEVITWKQLGIFHKPIVILNTNGYFDSLLALFNTAVQEHFMSKSNLELWHVATTPEDAFSYLRQCNEQYSPAKPKY